MLNFSNELRIAGSVFYRAYGLFTKVFALQAIAMSVLYEMTSAYTIHTAFGFFAIAFIVAGFPVMFGTRKDQ